MTAPDALELAARRLETETAVGVDLEADSMFHFQEKVCLVQIAGRDRCYLVDTLQTGGLSALQPFFADTEIRKIFHGSDYDIRSLHRDFGIEVVNLFDTQLACRFLGMKFTGLDAVLNLFFGIHLEKKFQKKDWSQRPLPNEMLEYAARDAIYLRELSVLLEERMAETGRWDWFRAECEHYSHVRCAPSNGEPRFLRFKGAGRLSRRSLAVLEALLEFRESVARELDRPLYQVIHNDVLLRLTVEKPQRMEQLDTSGILSAKQLKRYGVRIVEAIAGAMSLKSSRLPVYPRHREPTPDESVVARATALKKWRDSVAATLEIEPALLGNNALMTAISQRNPENMDALSEIDGIRPWLLQAYGNNILTVLAERSKISG